LSTPSEYLRPKRKSFEGNNFDEEEPGFIPGGWVRWKREGKTYVCKSFCMCTCIWKTLFFLPWTALKLVKLAELLFYD
jgi:hypothetical protein